MIFCSKKIHAKKIPMMVKEFNLDCFYHSGAVNMTRAIFSFSCAHFAFFSLILLKFIFLQSKPQFRGQQNCDTHRCNETVIFAHPRTGVACCRLLCMAKKAEKTNSRCCQLQRQVILYYYFIGRLAL